MQRLGLWSSMSEPFPPPHYSQRHETVHVISCEALEHNMRLCGNKRRARTSCWLLNCQHSHKDIVNGFDSIQILFTLSYHHYFLVLSVLSKVHLYRYLPKSMNEYASVSTGAKPRLCYVRVSFTLFRIKRVRIHHLSFQYLLSIGCRYLITSCQSHLTQRDLSDRRCL